MQTFSSRLIALRKEKRLTQEELANLISKKRSTVSGYETEGKEPDIETICFLAKFFGVSTDYLLGYSDEASGGAITDPVALSDLMALQSQLKNEISCLLDKLMQADMEIAFQIKSGSGTEFSGELSDATAM